MNIKKIYSNIAKANEAYGMNENSSIWIVITRLIKALCCLYPSKELPQGDIENSQCNNSYDSWNSIMELKPKLGNMKDLLSTIFLISKIIGRTFQFYFSNIYIGNLSNSHRLYDFQEYTSTDNNKIFKNRISIPLSNLIKGYSGNKHLFLISETVDGRDVKVISTIDRGVSLYSRYYSRVKGSKMFPLSWVANRRIITIEDENQVRWYALKKDCFLYHGIWYMNDHCVIAKDTGNRIPSWMGYTCDRGDVYEIESNTPRTDIQMGYSTRINLWYYVNRGKGIERISDIEGKSKKRERYYVTELEVFFPNRKNRIDCLYDIKDLNLGITYKNDGSIPTHGTEFVTTPCTYDASIEVMEKIVELIRSYNGKGDHEDCGMHIHVDRYDSKSTITKAGLFFNRVNRDFLLKLGSRKGNYGNLEFKDFTFKDAIAGLSYNRYYCFNTRPESHELRLFGSSVRMDRVQKGLDLYDSVLNYCSESSLRMIPDRKTLLLDPNYKEGFNLNSRTPINHITKQMNREWLSYLFKSNKYNTLKRFIARQSSDILLQTNTGLINEIPKELDRYIGSNINGNNRGLPFDNLLIGNQRIKQLIQQHTSNS